MDEIIYAQICIMSIKEKRNMASYGFWGTRFNINLIILADIRLTIFTILTVDIKNRWPILILRFLNHDESNVITSRSLLVFIDPYSRVPWWRQQITQSSTEYNESKICMMVAHHSTEKEATTPEINSKN